MCWQERLPHSELPGPAPAVAVRTRADRLRAELEELTGKPVLLAIGDGEPGPPVRAG